MRIAFFARSKRRTRTTAFISDALRRAGHDVLRIDERRWRRRAGSRLARAWALARVARFGPDRVLVHGTDASRPTLARLVERYETIAFTPDCWGRVGGDLLERARSVHLLLTVAKGQIPALEAAGVRRAAWLPEACAPEVHHPEPDGRPEFASQLAFIGKRGGSPERQKGRVELLRAAAARFDLALYGSGWEALGLAPRRPEIGADDYRRVCRGADIVLGRDWTDSCELYFSNRTWFTLGCGGFLLTNHVPGLERLFTNHGELVWYRSVDECLELAGHYLERPDERRRIAEAGRAFALAHRTYDHFARDLVDVAEGRPLALAGQLR